jgi:hypothetical protein
MEEGVQLTEGELAVEAHEGDGDGSEVDAEDRACIVIARWERRLTGARRAPSPAFGGRRPEGLVDGEGLVERDAAAVHPREGIVVELVELLDDVLSHLVEADSGGGAEVGAQAGPGVGIVLQPTRGRGKRTVGASVHRGPRLRSRSGGPGAADRFVRSILAEGCNTIRDRQPANRRRFAG